MSRTEYPHHLCIFLTRRMVFDLAPNTLRLFVRSPRVLVKKMKQQQMIPMI
jgi:hypothetical protein